MGHYFPLVMLCVFVPILSGCEQSPDAVSNTAGTPTAQQSSSSASQTDPIGNERLSVSTDGNHTVNDIGIATFPTPPDWLSNRSGGNTSVALIRKGTSRTKQPDEMISIDVGTPTEADAKSSAASLAKKFGGTASEMPIKIDGEIMYRVSVPPNYNRLMPRECIVTHHDSKVCFIFGASKTHDEIWPAVSEIVESWRWN